MITEEKRIIKKQIWVYLALVYGYCFGLGIVALFTNSGDTNPVYSFLQKSFTLVPILAAVITQRVLHIKTPAKTFMNVNLKVWKNWKMWLFCAFVPAIAIAVGAVVYFIIFKSNYAGTFDIAELMALFGMSAESNVITVNPIIFIAANVLISAVMIPLQFLELGEEIGWRGFLLPLQVQRMGARKAVLLNGVLWGIAHAPLIYFGFNYAGDTPFAPWSNILMMIVMCVVIGIIESYTMLRTNNCMYAAIIHGAVNVIAEVPVFLSVSGKSTLLGPNPTGIIGMAGLIVLAAVLLIKMPDGQECANIKA